MPKRTPKTEIHLLIAQVIGKVARYTKIRSPKFLRHLLLKLISLKRKMLNVAVKVKVKDREEILYGSTIVKTNMTIDKRNKLENFFLKKRRLTWPKRVKQKALEADKGNLNK